MRVSGQVIYLNIYYICIYLAIVTFPVSVRISPVCTVQYYNMSFLNIEKEENDQNMQYLQRQLVDR